MNNVVKESERLKEEFKKLGYKYSYDDGYIEYRKKDTTRLEPTLICFDISEQEVFVSRIGKQFKDISLSLDLLILIKQQSNVLWKRFRDGDN